MDERYVEAVLAVVGTVEAGRVTTYGAVAAAVGRGGPRQVGRVMRLHGDAVAWWRVVTRIWFATNCTRSSSRSPAAARDIVMPRSRTAARRSSMRFSRHDRAGT